MTLVVGVVIVVALQSNSWQSTDRLEPDRTMAPIRVEPAVADAPFSLQGGWRGLDRMATQDPVAPRADDRDAADASATTASADPSPGPATVPDHGINQPNLTPQDTVASGIELPNTKSMAGDPPAFVPQVQSPPTARNDAEEEAPQTASSVGAPPATVAQQSPPTVAPPAAPTNEPTAAPQLPIAAAPPLATMQPAPIEPKSTPAQSAPAESEAAAPEPTSSETGAIAIVPSSIGPADADTESNATTTTALAAAPTLRDKLHLPRRKPDWILRMAIERSADARQARVKPIRHAATPVPVKGKPTGELPLASSFGRLERTAP